MPGGFTPCWAGCCVPGTSLRALSSNRSRFPVSRLFVRFSLLLVCEVSDQIPGTRCDQSGCGRNMIMNPEGDIVAAYIFEGKNSNVSVPSRWLVKGRDMNTRYLAQSQKIVARFVPGLYISGQQPTPSAVAVVANTIEGGSGLPPKTEFTSNVLGPYFRLTLKFGTRVL